jgi:hypothetical protein
MIYNDNEEVVCNMKSDMSDVKKLVGKTGG